MFGQYMRGGIEGILVIVTSNQTDFTYLVDSAFERGGVELKGNVQVGSSTLSIRDLFWWIP